jgi:AraC-like DNA-binding protein
MTKTITKIVNSLKSDSYLRLHKCWDVRAPANWGTKSQKISYDCHHIIFFRSGGAFYDVEEKRFEMEAGKLFFLQSGQSFSYGYSGKPPQICQAHFNLWSRSKDKKIELPQSNNVIHLATWRQSLYEQLFQLLYERWLDLGGAVDRCSDVLQTILRQVEDDLKYQAGKFDKRLEEIRKFMDQNPLNRNDVNTLAKRCGLSQKYFTRRFREQYGISPKSYQVRARCQYARYLLEEEQLNVVEVADRLDYSDPFVFSRQFKKAFGKSPGAVRLKPGSAG